MLEIVCYCGKALRFKKSQAIPSPLPTHFLLVAQDVSSQLPDPAATSVLSSWTLIPLEPRALINSFSLSCPGHGALSQQEKGN